MNIFTVGTSVQQPETRLRIVADLSSQILPLAARSRVDETKRGYDVAADAEGQLMWYNPFYMNYAPDAEGNFNGQTGYGNISFENFVDAVTALKESKVTLEELDTRGLPTLKNTIATTALLEAGRRNSDEGGGVEIVQIAISLGCGVNVAVRNFVSPLRTLGAEIMRLQTHEVKTVTGTRVIPNSWPFADESGLDDTSLGDLGYRSS